MAKRPEMLGAREGREHRFLNVFFCVVFIVILLIFAADFWFTQNYVLVIVDGRSMEDTLSDGDALYVSVREEVERGDIIVLNVTSRPDLFPHEAGEERFIIKRAIALEGDEIYAEGGIVYLKAADKISDFLRCIGAHEALMRFEDIRIHRDFRNNLTRLDNCEVANEMKSQAAARRQLEDIARIEKAGRMRFLDEKLRAVAELRQRYPEASLNELSAEYQRQTGVAMSKSGMKHRFIRLHELAEQIGE